jgi:signal transduction histidine kinase
VQRYIQPVGRQIFLADAAVPVMVGAVIAVGVVVRGDPATAHLALLLGLASAAVLVARRRAPAATLAASGGLVLALFAVDPAVGASAVFAPAVALYTVVLRRGRIHQLLAALAAVSAVIATDVVLAGRATVTPQTIAHVTLVAVPLLAAEALRTRRSYISLLLERLELAERTREQEARRLVGQERLRIARDLHDVVAHTLTTINVQAGVAAHLLDRDPEHARGALATIEEASRDALDELRAVVGVLRDPDTDPGTSVGSGASAVASTGTDVEGVPLEPAPTVGAVGDLVERARANGLDVDLDIHGDRPDRLPDAVGLAAYRIVQESLTNVRRHAPGAPADVHLTFEPGRILVTVENSSSTPHDTASTSTGTSTSTSTSTDIDIDIGGAANTGTGVGIIGMKERAAAIGGTLDAAPTASGFRVHAELPYRRAEAPG